MSSGFVTESEIAETKKRRQEEWEKVRTADQPLEVPEEVFDPRPLYQRLEEQKQKKDAEYEETHKLKNMIRGLDDDEVGFLDLVERTKAVAARQISLEEQREMADFRERVSTLNEQAENERLAQQLKTATSKRNTTSSNNTKNKLQGLVVRKRKASEVDGIQNGVVSPEKESTEEKKSRGEEKQESIVNGDVQHATVPSSSDEPILKCIGILPGLGFYENDTSDSDRSSDSDEDCHKAHEQSASSTKKVIKIIAGKKAKSLKCGAIWALF